MQLEIIACWCDVDTRIHAHDIVPAGLDSQMRGGGEQANRGNGFGGAGRSDEHGYRDDRGGDGSNPVATPGGHVEPPTARVGESSPWVAAETRLWGIGGEGLIRPARCP